MFASNLGSSSTSSTELSNFMVPDAESVKDDLQRFVPTQYCYLPHLGHYVPVIIRPTEPSATVKEESMENQEIIVPENVSTQSTCGSQEISIGPPNSEPHLLEEKYQIKQEVIVPENVSTETTCDSQEISIGPPDSELRLFEEQHQIKQEVIVPDNVSTESCCDSQESVSSRDCVLRDCIRIGPPNPELCLIEKKYQINQEEVKEIIDCHMDDEDFAFAGSLQNFQVASARQYEEQRMLQLPRTNGNPEQEHETPDLATPPDASLMIQKAYVCYNLHHRVLVYHKGDGYYYHTKRVGVRWVDMTCAASDKCFGRATMPTRSSERLKRLLVITQGHNHSPDLNWITVMKVKEKLAMKVKENILKRSRTEGTSFEQIVKDETERLRPEIEKTSGLQPTFLDSLRIILYGLKKDNRLKKDSTRVFIPSNLLHYGEFLETNQRFGYSENNKPFFRATVKDDADNAAVIFISENLSEVLPQTTHVQVDCTWRVMPSTPASHHLLIIAPVYECVVLPTIFVMMEKKTEVLYQLVFTFVKQTFPQWAPELFTTDYNGLLHNVLRRLWPAAAVVGSWCHTAHCMTVKMNHLGHTDTLLWNNKDANQVFKKCQALPFLPPEKVQEGYDHIVDFADRTRTLNSLAVFLNYVHRVWLKGVGVESFSVYGQKERTFNAMETFYQRLHRYLKSPPHSIWLFTDALRKLESYVASQLEIHLRKRDASNKRAILSNKTMIHLQSNLARNVIGVEEFLKSVSHQIEFCHNQVYNVLKNEDCDDEILEELKASWLPQEVPIRKLKKKKKKQKVGEKRKRKQKSHARPKTHRPKSADRGSNDTSCEDA